MTSHKDKNPPTRTEYPTFLDALVFIVCILCFLALAMIFASAVL